MKREDTALLNLAALDNALRAQGVKQWWLADQVGVSRKTVTRWLTGKVRSVRSETLARVAAVLGVPVATLALADEAQAFASREQQTEAARLIESERLMEILGPAGKWSLLEGLIKATLQPQLPLPLLGQLYNQLSIAAWRQSDLARAESYAVKALGVGEASGHRATLAEAHLNLATLAALRGRLEESLAQYLACLTDERYLEDRLTIGKALSNVGMTYAEYGDLARADAFQDRAIAVFTELAKPFNLAIAWIGKALVALEAARLDDAALFCEKARFCAIAAGYRRAVADADCARAEIAARRGHAAEAAAIYAAAAAVHAELGIVEARTPLCGARIARLAGDVAGAEAELAVARTRAAAFPVAAAEVLAETWALATAQGNEGAAHAARIALTQAYQRITATPRLKALLAGGAPAVP